MNPLKRKIALNLRLPHDLHRKLKRAAAENGNSLNAEINRRLEMFEALQVIDSVRVAIRVLREAINGEQTAAEARPTAQERASQAATDPTQPA